MAHADCLFCKITRGELPSVKIFEDEHTLAFLDIRQETIGHTLVILKTHSENILEAEDKDLGLLFRTVKKVVGLVKQGLAPAGFTISINHGRVAGQIIDHLHVHIIPRYEEMHIHRVLPSGDKKLEMIRDKILEGGNR